MEQITLSFPASRALSGRALAGVVGSGDMEVLYTAAQSATLNVQITALLQIVGGDKLIIPFC